MSQKSPANQRLLDTEEYDEEKQKLNNESQDQTMSQTVNESTITTSLANAKGQKKSSLKKGSDSPVLKDISKEKQANVRIAEQKVPSKAKSQGSRKFSNYTESVIDLDEKNVWYNADLMADVTKGVKARLCAVACICFLFICIEITGGILADSLAILADAAHLMCDLIGFLLS